jgi:hypothetical protein
LRYSCHREDTVIKKIGSSRVPGLWFAAPEEKAALATTAAPVLSAAPAVPGVEVVAAAALPPLTEREHHAFRLTESRDTLRTLILAA